MNEKKKSRKSLLVFFLILLCAGVAGFVSGYVSAIFTGDKDIPEMIRLFFADHAIVIIAVCLVVAVLHSVILLYAWLKMRRMEKTIDMDADDATDEIDRLFAKAGIVSSIAAVLDLVFMGSSSIASTRWKQR